MKKTILFVIAAVMLSFTACDGKMSLTSYHEKAMGEFNNLYKHIIKERETIFGHKLSKEENQKLIDGMNASLDSAMTMMNSLKFPDDAKNFHESMMQIYKYEKDTLMPILHKTLSFEPESKEWYETWRDYDKKNERINEMQDQLEKHQKELAEKAGAKIR